MAVFRVERTRDYTVMSNHHLRNKALSLKAKGLLSQMLSLPEDWDYTLTGLSFINRESKDAIRSAVNELEKVGYITRHQTTDASGKFAGNEYLIHEAPEPFPPSLEKPLSENPTTEKPSSGKPSSENPTQLNKELLNTQIKNKDGANTDSLLSAPRPAAAALEWKRSEAAPRDDYLSYLELVKENIEYDHLCRTCPDDRETLDEILELIVETVTAKRQYTRVAGAEFPHEAVRSRLLKLESEHIKFVLMCMNENTTKVKNIKQYLLTVLYNAPITINSYYQALVNHDMYGGSK